MKQPEILTSKEAAKAQQSRRSFSREMRRKGYEKVAPGVYASPEAWIDPLALVIHRCPHAVISHDEALFHYGLLLREPEKTTITVYSGYNSSRLKRSGYRVFYVKKELLGLGLSYVTDAFGQRVPMYDLERTVCDLVRSRSQFDSGEYRTALQAYARRSDKDLRKLFAYAEAFHIAKILKEYMEILL